MIDVRRRTLCAALAAGALAAGVRPAAAQVGAMVDVQRSARAWLALADADDGAGSWQAAGRQFRNAIAAPRWSAALAAVRGPLGAVVQRTAASTQFVGTFPGAPDGEYAILVFRTAFAHKAEGRETLTLEREPDGQWRVAGYFVQ